jgi:hypothetical protein
VLTSYPGPGGSKSITRKLYVLMKDKSMIDIGHLQNKIKLIGVDNWARDEVLRLKQRVEDLKKMKADETLVPGFVEITVVMPNS